MKAYLPSPTETVSTGAGVVTAYASIIIAQKLGLPVEVAGVMVGGAVGVARRLVRWISDRMPEPKKK
jgi:phosphate/sulfate permease